MTNRMTDERMAEIEATHAEVEPLARPHPRPRNSIKPLDISDPWFYWEEMPGLTTQQTHQQRGELLQALKAERERLGYVEVEAVESQEIIGELKQEVERLHSLSETATNRAMLEHDRTEAAEAKLAKVLEGLDEFADRLLTYSGSPLLQVKLQAIIKEARDE